MTAPEERRRLRLLVSGRVQGVFFRMFVLREAGALGLVGVVRNLPDGRVEVEAEGTESALAQLARRLHVGPRGAVVEAVAEEREEPVGGLSDFHIDYL